MLQYKAIFVLKGRKNSNWQELVLNRLRVIPHDECSPSERTPLMKQLLLFLASVLKLKKDYINWRVFSDL